MIDKNNKSDQFLKWACRVYQFNKTVFPNCRHKIKEPSNDFNHYDYFNQRSESAKLALVEHLYREGFFITKSIEMSFEEFKNVLINKTKKRKKPYYSSFYSNHNTDFRKSLGYVKNYSKIENEPDYDKINWLKHKKHFKDKSKNNNRCRSYKTFAKKMSNRSFRRHLKELMDHGRFDEISTLTPKNYFDPWDWD